MAFLCCCPNDGPDSEVRPKVAQRRSDDTGFTDSLDQALGGTVATRAEGLAMREKTPGQAADDVNDAEDLAEIARPTQPVKVRPSEMFTATIHRDDRRMCIDVNKHDTKTLLITKVNPGPVHDFNKENPDREVAPGDRIEAVNGVKDDAMKMLEAFRSSTELELLVRRCTETTITFQPLPGCTKLGMSIQVADGMTLMLTGIDSKGLVGHHNLHHLDEEIEVEDRIIGVNGLRSDSVRLSEALLDTDSWELIIRRVWPSALRQGLDP